MKGLGIFDKILIFILLKENMLYTGESPLEAPLILWDTETVPYQLIFNDLYWTEIYAFKAGHYQPTSKAPFNREYLQ